MNRQQNMLLEILNEEEAWTLFKDTACLDDEPTTIDVAKMVAKECGCLVVAIVSVAKALRSKPLHEWERALKKLQDGEYHGILDMSKEENAIKSLKFSFDELPQKETKKCLLLCSLFPENYEICIEDLTRYAHGLRLYHNAQSVQDTMSEVLDALDELRDSYLLLEGETKGHVKMHRVVRDVVLLIGKSYLELICGKEFFVGSNIGLGEWPIDDSFRDYAALSLLDNEIEQFPDQTDHPRLEMLLFSRRTSILEEYVQKEFTNIPETSFEGMKKLQVLSLTRGILSIQSLESLTNLRTLELRYCKFSTGNSAIAADLFSLRNLQLLEILSLHGSDISELPDEIGELKNMKVLDLTNCYCLDRIPPNMIRKLSKLEELLIGAFEFWQVEGKGASVIELDSLQHLAILSIAARGHIPKDFAFSKLIGYHLHMCDCEYPKFQPRLKYPSVRSICIVPTKETIRVCKELFNNVFDLRLECNEECFKNMMPDMSQTGFKDLYRLDVFGCEMVCLVSTAKQKNVVRNAFSGLVELQIDNSTLREICEGQPSDGFLEQLQILTISSCDQMNTILPSKLLKGMQKIKKVMIDECENVEDVFQLDGLNEANKECLLHLESLELYNLNALMCVWKGPTHHLNLKSLTHLTVRYCESLPSLLSVSLAESLAHLEYLDVGGCDQLEYIIAEKDEESREVISEAYRTQLLQNLKIIKVEECNKLHHIFPITMGRGFPQLTEVCVKASDHLAAMFGTEDQACTDTIEEIVFPKLLKLILEELPKFNTFYPKGCDFKFPFLQHLKVKRCPEMITCFAAAPDGSIYANNKNEAAIPVQDTKIGSATAEVLVAPKSADNDLEWDLSKGNWICRKNSEEEEEEVEKENRS